MHLFLIRHGQSHINLAEWESGNTDEGLTDLGKRQAVALAKWLPQCEPNIDVIFTSTMRRALETAEPLATAYGQKPSYDDRLRDAMVKLLALKACWQVRQLKRFGCPVIIFFDEPALVGFGSSAFISISKEEVAACFREVTESVQKEGGLTGIHVCANAEWPIILDSPADIVSFDAYGFFERFSLYPDHIRKFMAKGGVLAWGIVPTLSVEDLEKETADSLFVKWKAQAETIESFGIDRSIIKAQSLITPSCGTGSLHLEHAIKVLQLTRQVSERVQKEY